MVLLQLRKHSCNCGSTSVDNQHQLSCVAEFGQQIHYPLQEILLRRRKHLLFQTVSRPSKLLFFYVYTQSTVHRFFFKGALHHRSCGPRNLYAWVAFPRCSRPPNVNGHLYYRRVRCMYCGSCSLIFLSCTNLLQYRALYHKLWLQL